MLNHIDIKFFKLAVGTSNLGKETNIDISAKCPVCGDSAKRKNSKRLHLYYKNNDNNDVDTKVNCFNGDCQVKNKTVYKFLKEFYPALFDQYKRETFSGTLKKISDGDVFQDFKKEKIETESKKEKLDILTQDFSMYFKKIEESNDALNYLESRKCSYTGEHGQWYFGTQDLKIGEKFYKLKNSIIVPFYYNNEMYGFYSRNIIEKEFSTYMHDRNLGYKIWNWFNIDKEQPAYVFEGIFDSISSGFINILSAVGASIPLDRIKELKKPIFVLDNDKTGLLNSLKYAKMGYTVYIQPQEYYEKDMNKLHLNRPNLNLRELIGNNLYSGISAEIRIKEKL